MKEVMLGKKEKEGKNQDDHNKSVIESEKPYLVELCCEHLNMMVIKRNES